ncbi:MAG: class I SAM-dependent methyltransferase [Kiritimatiellae bacterium]|nr:class I SAM-dependent methyltransferase [Kiritimatiellia bacterium]
MARYLALPGGRGAALDVCCGSGQGAIILQRRGYSPVYAFDRFAGAGKLLTAHGVKFSCSDFWQYAPPRRFDLITACDCLEHLPEPERVLRRIREWLAPGGTLFLAVPLEEELGHNQYHVNAWTREAMLLLLARCEWVIARELNDFDQGKIRFWGLLQ